MLRVGALIVICLALTGCTLVDFGVGRDKCPAHWEWNGAGGYADLGWPATSEVLSADLLGGPNSGTLVSVDLWRLVHLELGLLGFGVGLGPLQFGGGVGWYTPAAPAMIDHWCPFTEMKMEHAH